MIKASIVLSVLMYLSFHGQTAWAGMLSSIGLHWQNSSFHPEAEEDTDNYYGIGTRLEFGYSLWNAIDLKGFASYTPLNKGAAKFFSGDVNSMSYGLGTALRFGGSAFIGLDYGELDYRAPNNPSEHQASGVWKGQGSSLHLGGLLKGGGSSYWQLALQVSRFDVKSENSTLLTERKVDTFQLSVTYLFMAAERKQLPFFK